MPIVEAPSLPDRQRIEADCSGGSGTSGTMTTQPSRRTILRALVWLGLSPALGLRASATTSALPFRAPESAAALGDAYLRLRPREATPARLRRLLDLGTTVRPGDDLHTSP